MTCPALAGSAGAGVLFLFPVLGVGDRSGLCYIRVRIIMHSAMQALSLVARAGMKDVRSAEEVGFCAHSSGIVLLAKDEMDAHGNTTE